MNSDVMDTNFVLVTMMIMMIMTTIMEIIMAINMEMIPMRQTNCKK